MKAVLLVVCMSLFPLAAQNNSETRHLTVSAHTVNGVVVSRAALSAQSIEESSGIVYLKGNIEVSLGTYTVTADEAEYDRNTGEVQARGNVRVKPILPEIRRGVSQFGIK